MGLLDPERSRMKELVEANDIGDEFYELLEGWYEEGPKRIEDGRTWEFWYGYTVERTEGKEVTYEVAIEVCDELLNEHGEQGLAEYFYFNESESARKLDA